MTLRTSNHEVKVMPTEDLTESRSNLTLLHSKEFFKDFFENLPSVSKNFYPEFRVKFTFDAAHLLGVRCYASSVMQWSNKVRYISPDLHVNLDE